LGQQASTGAPINLIEKMLEERGSNYGKFEIQALYAQCLKGDMRNMHRWPELHPIMREALDMIQHKISRILNGDPFYLDSWQDIIGYTQLVVNYIVEIDDESK
jgi:hypothetical protein